MSSYFLEVWKTQLAFLFFRPVRPDLESRFGYYLVHVILVTFAVGVGRYWDHSSAQAWQYFGLGSIAYIFLLSAFLYVLLLPLRPRRLSYKVVFVFVGLTSLPGIFYAIPVVRFFALSTAQSLNALFLAVVALWRVGLYLNFLDKVAELEGSAMFVALLLPLSAIVVALSMLNLEHAVFEIMAGNAENPSTAADSAYVIVITLTVFASLAFPITLLMYFYAIYKRF